MDSVGELRLPHRPKLPMGRRNSGGRRMMGDADSSPVSWQRYWTSRQDVKVPADEDASSQSEDFSFQQSKDSSSQSGEGDVFRVYTRGDSGPLLVLLHGGGYNALTWSLMVEEVFQSVPECRALAFDQRGHGSSRVTDTLDLSADTLARDVGRVLRAVYDTIPGPIVLVGHSMGGAVAVHAEYNDAIGAAVAGLVVVDVVEGTAMAALSAMNGVLASRPKTFPSLQQAVLWSYRSGQTRNLEAARVSMPGQVRSADTGQCGADLVTDEQCSITAPDVSSTTPAANSGAGRHRRLSRGLSADSCNIIAEEADESEEGSSSELTSIADESDSSATDQQKHTELYRQLVSRKQSQDAAPGITEANVADSTEMAPPQQEFKWAIDLSRTTDHWSGWFTGLSKRFLSVRPAKLLLLAGVDRLDTDLMVAQMQGQFQMRVVGQCGHAVHEDAPHDVAQALVTFLTRHKLVASATTQDGGFPLSY